MNINNESKPLDVISFLSGKGGSGKTSAALGISRLLSDIGFKTLLIDFDLATGGSSYFFMPRLTNQKQIGLLELVQSTKNLNELLDVSKDADFIKHQNLILEVEKNFDFIPSRSERRAHPSIDYSYFSEDILAEKILQPLIHRFGNDYDYILIDNQAGHSASSAAAARVSTKTIIVSESDRISSDAVDDLISSLGSNLPNFRRYLINKVEIREAGDYRQKVLAFQELNRLPPLPFDFGVRNAFGNREIPINLDKPTSFLIALFTTLKDIIPEKEEIINKYENEIITVAFDRYQNELTSLLEKRSAKEEKMLELVKVDYERKLLNTRLFMRSYAVLVVLAVGFYALVKFIPDLFNTSALNATIGITAFGVIAALMMVVLYSRSRIQLEKLNSERSVTTFHLKRELSEIESEVDRYRNLMATRAQELLVDFDKTAYIK